MTLCMGVCVCVYVYKLLSSYSELYMHSKMDPEISNL